MTSMKPDSLHTIPSATGGITRLACARLREHGKDVRSILIRAGFVPEAVENPAARLEARRQIKVLELAAEELDDDLFGFHLAHDFDVRDLGLVYYVMASSEQLADALRNVERYSQIVNEGVVLRVQLGDGATLALDYVDFDRGPDRHHIEFWLVALMRICRALTDSRFAPRRLRVKHVRHDPPAAFRSFFGVDIEFGCDVDEIVLSAPVASLPAARRDTHLNDLLRRYAEDALASRATLRKSVRSEVEMILSELLPHGKAGATEVARRLGMSPRSLSRRLHESGTSFTAILDEFRGTLAERYLSERQRSVSEIAWLLGYQEISSLTHAFKRWTGTTPRKFRLTRSGGKQEAGKAPARRAGHHRQLQG